MKRILVMAIMLPLILTGCNEDDKGFYGKNIEPPVEVVEPIDITASELIGGEYYVSTSTENINYQYSTLSDLKFGEGLLPGQDSMAMLVDSERFGISGIISKYTSGVTNRVQAAQDANRDIQEHLVLRGLDFKQIDSYVSVNLDGSFILITDYKLTSSEAVSSHGVRNDLIEVIESGVNIILPYDLSGEVIDTEFLLTVVYTDMGEDGYVSYMVVPESKKAEAVRDFNGLIYNDSFKYR